MAVAFGQNLGSTGNGTAGQTSTVLSPSSKTVTVGNVIVVKWGCYFDITATAVTDNLGNVYARVERKRITQATSDVWAAPVTVGGSITTITVTHPPTQFLFMIAEEYSGAAYPPAPADGQTGAAVATIAWCNNKTIPANGLVTGMDSCNSNGTQTAGAASGTPSTSITLVEFFNGAGNQSGGSAYAVAGATPVTGFTGTIAISGTGDSAGAGAILYPVQWVRPDADTTTTGWTSTPLWSKIEESSPDGTVITATAS